MRAQIFRHLKISISMRCPIAYIYAYAQAFCTKNVIDYKNKHKHQLMLIADEIQLILYPTLLCIVFDKLKLIYFVFGQGLNTSKGAYRKTFLIF